MSELKRFGQEQKQKQRKHFKRTMRSQAPRKTGAKWFEVPEPVFYGLYARANFTERSIFKSLLEYLRVVTFTLPAAEKIRRGDLVVMGDKDNHYRNSFVYIFNGTEIVPLDHNVDDYAAVPPSFQVISEFPITYWKDKIVHNCIVWFDASPYVKELKKNVGYLHHPSNNRDDDGHHRGGRTVMSFFHYGPDQIRYEIIADGLNEFKECIAKIQDRAIKRTTRLLDHRARASSIPVQDGEDGNDNTTMDADLFGYAGTNLVPQNGYRLYYGNDSLWI